MTRNGSSIVAFAIGKKWKVSRDIELIHILKYHILMGGVYSPVIQ